ncbi:MAG: hypothetical protein LWW85_11060, partial [Marinilabiliales bacterium]|nr:hypothetical protein [Marinilabiliales bacterium]
MAEAVEFEKANKIREAIKAYEEALALRKNDPFIKPKLKELSSDLKNLENDEKLEADFLKLLALGDQNVKDAKYSEAVNQFNGALVIKPNDPTATAKLANAKGLLDKLNADKAKQEAEFNRLLTAGDEQVTKQLYSEAISSYQSALVIKPADPTATSKLANAKGLLDKINADKAKQEAEFNRLLTTGDEQVNKQAYSEAISNYQAALVIKPAD